MVPALLERGSLAEAEATIRQRRDLLLRSLGSRLGQRCAHAAGLAGIQARRACFKPYGLLVDPSGWYGSMWRPFHTIGLETRISILSTVLRGEATGCSKEVRVDAEATAKRDLKPGDMLDSEGGFAVWAHAIPASKSMAVGALPIGLAHNVKLQRAVAKDTVVRFEDVVLDRDLDVVALRQGRHVP